MNIYFVYWIHLPEHTDPMTEGYIGISNNPIRRFKEHIGSIESKIGRIMNSKKTIQDIIIFEITKSQAEQIEKIYRPRMNIGWNVMSGGNVPPPTKKGRKGLAGELNPSKRPEVRKLISERLTGLVKKRGYKRPEHSALLKEKVGETYPKFRGWFITPWGKFASVVECLEKAPIKINVTSLYRWCQNSNKEITKMSARSKTLRNLFDKDSIVGKTYKEIGFDYVWANK